MALKLQSVKLQNEAQTICFLVFFNYDESLKYKVKFKNSLTNMYPTSRFNMNIFLYLSFQYFVHFQVNTRHHDIASHVLSMHLLEIRIFFYKVTLLSQITKLTVIP